MKKIITVATIMLASVAANAQNVQDESKTIIDKDFMRELLTNSAVLMGIFLFTTFFLTIIRTALDSRLKNKLIEKGASESIVSQLLQPLKKDSKLEPIKWFTILAGIGIGLSLINATQPLGIHSLAIMSFSLAASFLGYYFFTRNSEK
jgi:hypothetical protein